MDREPTLLHTCLVCTAPGTPGSPGTGHSTQGTYTLPSGEHMAGSAQGRGLESEPSLPGS